MGMGMGTSWVRVWVRYRDTHCHAPNMFGSENMAFLHFLQDISRHSQHTFLCFPCIFAIFWFLDDDYGIPPTAKTIHLLAPMLPFITMSITRRFSMVPLK